ncbi:S-adenosyl-L-methionine-dependent methyltransferase [Trichoderma sp. SZMC 28011]
MPAVTDNSDDYVLGRSFIETIRLDGQHFIFNLQNGYTIDPRIPINPDTKIAEIGTGTGIWLLDVSSQVPSTVQLHGFDISDEQFPPKSTLPSNITLQVMNAFEEVPEEHFQKYDVVHARLWCAIIRGCDTFALIRHVTQLLKPGGYLQWDEYDPDRGGAYIKGEEAEKLYSFASLIRKELNIDPSWLVDIPNRVKKAGLNVVEFRADPFSQAVIPIITKSLFAFHASLIAGGYKAGIPSLPPRHEGDAILEAALDAVKNRGGALHCTPLALLAQKPLA